MHLSKSSWLWKSTYYQYDRRIRLILTTWGRSPTPVYRVIWTLSAGNAARISRPGRNFGVFPVRGAATLSQSRPDASQQTVAYSITSLASKYRGARALALCRLTAVVDISVP